MAIDCTSLTLSGGPRLLANGTTGRTLAISCERWERPPIRGIRTDHPRVSAGAGLANDSSM